MKDLLKMIFQILPFSVLLSFLSCKQSLQTQKHDVAISDKTDYAKALIDEGFFKYADSSKVDSLKQQLLESFNIYDDDIFKTAHIDAEELAEFNFGSFLPDLNKILAKRNFSLSAIKQTVDEKSFNVLINGDTVQLCTIADLNNNIQWETAPRNFFKKVNQLLKAKDSNEQFYLLYGGNDLHTLLLSDKEFLLIKDYYKDNVNEQPYKP